jgi:hypothetical protein
VALVEEKVKEYINGQFSRSYTQVNIPASVASFGRDASEAMGVIGDIYSKNMVDKHNKNEQAYYKLKEIVDFLKQFEGIDEKFDKVIKHSSDSLDSTFSKYYIFEDGEMKLKTDSVKLIKVVVKVMIASFIGACFISYLEISQFLVIFLSSVSGLSLVSSLPIMGWEMLFGIPSKLKGAKSGFKYLESDFNKMNIFNMSNELAKVVNYFNSDSMRAKIYSNEISNDEYQLLFANALRKCIELNLNTTDKN